MSSILTTDPNTGNVSLVGNISAGNLGMFRNRVINGDMRIAQRGSNIATEGYTLDRWYHSGYGALGMYSTVSQQTSSGISGIPNFLRVTQTSTGSYINSFLIYSFETNDVIPLRGEVCTVSCYTRVSTGWSVPVYFKVGTYTATDTRYNPASLPAGYILQNYSQLVANNQWTKIVLQFTVPSNANGITILMETINQPAAAGIGNYYDLTGVQLEKGSIATPFEFRPYSTELQLCQRYYETVHDVVGGINCGMSYYYSGGGATQAFLPFKVTKRAVPTIAKGSIASGFGTASFQLTANYLSHYISLTSTTVFYYTVTGPVDVSAEL